MKGTLRNLVLVLGDQLDQESSALVGFDPAQDAVWMAEVQAESTHVWSHKARIALFLSAMRHFRDALAAKHWRVFYTELDAADNRQTLADELTRALECHRPQGLKVCQPGDWRVQRDLQAVAAAHGLPLEITEDTHFLCTLAEFTRHASARKQLRMEFFYREMRRDYRVLMNGAQPEGGRWNFDSENRSRFPKSEAPEIEPPQPFKPDATTQAVLNLVEAVFPDHPGELAHFDWPVTPEQAQHALSDFIRHRLPAFGQYQDAMWDAGLLPSQPFLYHSKLSTALNLKLIRPLTVIRAVEEAYRQKQAPLEAAEGYIRQILGWREYVRGIYWLKMPEYLDLNALQATAPLPAFYWDGEIEMNCLRQAIGQTLAYGYAHHIQRLMVTGLFALLLGVRPQALHAWYLAVYVDAVEWVELPNTLGMSQFGDGGFMASKPYVATGKYIQRMSNYCERCPYDPAQATGESACPFTTLYWDFLQRHEALLAKNPRMGLQVRNLARLSAERQADVQNAAQVLKARFAASAGEKQPSSK